MNTGTTKIYFIATLDRSVVKIGHTRNLARRLAAFRHASPLQLEVLACVPGSPDDERAIHAKFVAHHSHGEWFKGHPEIIECAATLAASGELPPELRGEPYQENPLNNRRRRRGYKRPAEHVRNVAEGIRRAHQRREARIDAAFHESDIQFMGHA